MRIIPLKLAGTLVIGPRPDGGRPYKCGTRLEHSRVMAGSETARKGGGGGIVIRVNFTFVNCKACLEYILYNHYRTVGLFHIERTRAALASNLVFFF